MSLLTTPSSGVVEVLRALRGLAASEGRYVAPHKLRRELGPRAADADIETVLTGLAGDPRLEDDGAGNYSLTATGVLFTRASRPSRRYEDT